MQSKSHRLDRFISQHCQIKRADVRLLLAQGRVLLNGEVARDINQLVQAFDEVLLDGQVLQAKQARYLMLHKPIGVVSATRDAQHKTVLDLLPENLRQDLHIAGRLDLNSSGLLLLSNDGRWSRRLSAPEHKVPKVYQVTLQNPLNDEYVPAFAAGMYFSYENITTAPAQLRILSDYVAEVILSEGKYHQIKRMFGRFRNPVLALHRSAIGDIVLDEHLAAGQFRELTPAEIRSIA